METRSTANHSLRSRVQIRVVPKLKGVRRSSSLGKIRGKRPGQSPSHSEDADVESIVSSYTVDTDREEDNELDDSTQDEAEFPSLLDLDLEHNYCKSETEPGEPVAPACAQKRRGRSSRATKVKPSRENYSVEGVVDASNTAHLPSAEELPEASTSCQPVRQKPQRPPRGTVQGPLKTLSLRGAKVREVNTSQTLIHADNSPGVKSESVTLVRKPGKRGRPVHSKVGARGLGRGGRGRKRGNVSLSHGTSKTIKERPLDTEESDSGPEVKQRRDQPKFVVIRGQASYRSRRGRGRGRGIAQSGNTLRGKVGRIVSRGRGAWKKSRPRGALQGTPNRDVYSFPSDVSEDECNRDATTKKTEGSLLIEFAASRGILSVSTQNPPKEFVPAVSPEHDTAVAFQEDVSSNEVFPSPKFSSPPKTYMKPRSGPQSPRTLLSAAKPTEESAATKSEPTEGKETGSDNCLNLTGRTNKNLSPSAEKHKEVQVIIPKLDIKSSLSPAGKIKSVVAGDGKTRNLSVVGDSTEKESKNIISLLKHHVGKGKQTSSSTKEKSEAPSERTKPMSHTDTRDPENEGDSRGSAGSKGERKNVFEQFAFSEKAKPDSQNDTSDSNVDSVLQGSSLDLGKKTDIGIKGKGGRKAKDGKGQEIEVHHGQLRHGKVWKKPMKKVRKMPITMTSDTELPSDSFVPEKSGQIRRKNKRETKKELYNRRLEWLRLGRLKRALVKCGKWKNQQRQKILQELDVANDTLPQCAHVAEECSDNPNGEPCEPVGKRGRKGHAIIGRAKQQNAFEVKCSKGKVPLTKGVEETTASQELHVIAPPGKVTKTRKPVKRRCLRRTEAEMLLNSDKIFSRKTVASIATKSPKKKHLDIVMQKTGVFAGEESFYDTETDLPRMTKESDVKPVSDFHKSAVESLLYVTPSRKAKSVQKSLPVQAVRKGRKSGHQSCLATGNQLSKTTHSQEHESLAPMKSTGRSKKKMTNIIEITSEKPSITKANRFEKEPIQSSTGDITKEKEKSLTPVLAKVSKKTARKSLGTSGKRQVADLQMVKKLDQEGIVDGISVESALMPKTRLRPAKSKDTGPEESMLVNSDMDIAMFDKGGSKLPRRSVGRRKSLPTDQEYNEDKVQMNSGQDLDETADSSAKETDDESGTPELGLHPKRRSRGPRKYLASKKDADQESQPEMEMECVEGPVNDTDSDVGSVDTPPFTSPRGRSTRKTVGKGNKQVSTYTPPYAKCSSNTGISEEKDKGAISDPLPKNSDSEAANLVPIPIKSKLRTSGKPTVKKGGAAKSAIEIVSTQVMEQELPTAKHPGKPKKHPLTTGKGDSYAKLETDSGSKMEGLKTLQERDAHDAVSAVVDSVQLQTDVPKFPRQSHEHARNSDLSQYNTPQEGTKTTPDNLTSESALNNNHPKTGLTDSDQRTVMEGNGNKGVAVGNVKTAAAKPKLGPRMARKSFPNVQRRTADVFSPGAAATTDDGMPQIDFVGSKATPERPLHTARKTMIGKRTSPSPKAQSLGDFMPTLVLQLTTGHLQGSACDSSMLSSQTPESTESVSDKKIEIDDLKTESDTLGPMDVTVTKDIEEDQEFKEAQFESSCLSKDDDVPVEANKVKVSAEEKNMDEPAQEEILVQQLDAKSIEVVSEIKQLKDNIETTIKEIKVHPDEKTESEHCSDNEQNTDDEAAVQVMAGQIETKPEDPKEHTEIAQGSENRSESQLPIQHINIEMPLTDNVSKGKECETDSDLQVSVQEAEGDGLNIVTPTLALTLETKAESVEVAEPAVKVSTIEISTKAVKCMENEEAADAGAQTMFPDQDGEVPALQGKKVATDILETDSSESRNGHQETPPPILEVQVSTDEGASVSTITDEQKRLCFDESTTTSMHNAIEGVELTIDQSFVAPEMVHREKKIAGEATETATLTDKDSGPSAERSENTEMIETKIEGQTTVVGISLTVPQDKEETHQDAEKAGYVQSDLQPEEEKTCKEDMSSVTDSPMTEPINDQVSQFVKEDSEEMTKKPPVISKDAMYITGDKRTPLQDSLEIMKGVVSEDSNEDTVHAICSDALNEIVNSAVRSASNRNINQSVSVSVKEHMLTKDDNTAEHSKMEPVRDIEQLSGQVNLVEKLRSDVASQDQVSKNEKDSVLVSGDVHGQEVEEIADAKDDDKKDVSLIKKIKDTDMVLIEGTSMLTSGNNQISPGGMQTKGRPKDAEERQEIYSKEIETDHKKLQSKVEDSGEKEKDATCLSSKNEANVGCKGESKGYAENPDVSQLLPAAEHVKESQSQRTLETSSTEMQAHKLPEISEHQIGSESCEILSNGSKSEETEIIEASDKVIDIVSVAASGAAEVAVSSGLSVLQDSSKGSPSKRKWKRRGGRGRGRRRPETERLLNPDPPSRKRKYTSVNEELDDNGTAKQTLLEDVEPEPAPSVSETATSKSPTAMAQGPTKMTTRGKKNRFWYIYAKQKRPKRESAEQKKLTALQKAGEPEKITDINRTNAVECSGAEKVVQSKPCEGVPRETKDAQPNNIDEMLAECKPCSVVLVDFIRCLDLSRIQTLMTPGESNSYSSSLEDNVDTEDETVDSPTSGLTPTPIATPQDTTSGTMPILPPPKPITTSSAFEKQFLSFIEEPNKKNTSDQTNQANKLITDSFKSAASEIPTSESSQEPIKEKPVEPMDTSVSQVTVNTEVKDTAVPTLISKKPIGSYSAPKFICLHCTYTTNIKSTMTDHIYNHTDVIPYKCGICGSIFTTRSGVLIHTRREHHNCPPVVIKTDEIREEDYYTTYEEVHSLYQPSSSIHKAGNETVAKVMEKQSEVSQQATEKGVSKRRLPGRVASSKQSQPQTLCSLLALAPKTATPPLTAHQSGLQNEQIEAITDVAKSQTKSVEGESGLETGTVNTAPARHSHRKRSRSKSPTRRIRQKTGNSDNGGRTSPFSRKGTMRPRIPNIDTADPTLPYYQCRHCTYSTNSSSHIKQHVETLHKEEQRYTCPLCDLAYFKYEDGVRRHFQKTHPGQPVILLLQPDYYDVNEQSSFTRHMTETTVRTLLPDVHEKKKVPGQKLLPAGGESLLKPSVPGKREATSPGALPLPSSGSISPAHTSVSPVRPVTPIILRIPTVYPRSTTPGSKSDLSSPRSLNEEAISKSQTDSTLSMTEGSDRPKSVPPSIKIASDGTVRQASKNKKVGPIGEENAVPDESPLQQPADAQVISCPGVSSVVQGTSHEETSSQMELDTPKTDPLSTMQMSSKCTEQVSSEGTARVVDNAAVANLTMEGKADISGAADQASSQTEGTLDDITACAGSPVNALDLSIKLPKETTDKTTAVPVVAPAVDGGDEDSQGKQQDYMCREVSSTSEVQEKSHGDKMVVAMGSSVPKVPVDTDSVAGRKTSESRLPVPVVHAQDELNSDIIDGDNDSGLKIVNVMSLQGTELSPEKSTQPPTLPPASPSQGNYLYQCKKCQSSTPILDDIINHIDVAHKLEYWYACPYCPFGCSRLKANMFRHIKRQHPQADDNVALGLLDQEKYFRKLPMGGAVQTSVSHVPVCQGANMPAGSSVVNVQSGTQTVTTPSGGAMAKPLPKNTARKSMIPPGRLKQMADHLRKTLPQSVFKPKVDKPAGSDTDKSKSSPDEDVIIVGEEMAKRTASIHRRVASPLHVVKSTIPTETISPHKAMQRTGQPVRISHTQTKTSNEGSLYMDCEAGEETHPHDDSVIDEDVIIHETQPVTIITPRELPQDSGAVQQIPSPNPGQSRTLIIPGQQQESPVVNVQPVTSSSGAMQQTIVNRPPSIMPPRLSAHSRPASVVRQAVPQQTSLLSSSGNAGVSPAPPVEVTPIIIAPPNVTVSGSVMPRPPPLIPSNMPGKPQVSIPRTMQAPPLLRAPIVSGPASGGTLSRPMSQPRPSPSVPKVRSQDHSVRPPPARVTPVPPKPVRSAEKDLDEEEMSKEAFNVFNLAPRPPRPSAPSPALAAAARWSEKWSQRMPGPGFLGARQFEPRHPPPPYPSMLPAQGFQLGPRSFGPMQMRPHRIQAQGPRTMNAGPPRPGIGSGGVLSCPYCSHKATDGDSLHNHILSHAPNIQWTCPYCPSHNQMPKHAVSNHITGRHPGCQVVYIPYGVPL